MTTIEWPLSSSLRRARTSCAMSSKCSPVVGSSNRNRRPRGARPRGAETDWRAASASPAVSARKPASLRRCASPPDSVGTGWPSFT